MEKRVSSDKKKSSLDRRLDDFEEEFFSSILYDRGKYALEAGVGRDLRAEDNENRYLLAGHYNFTNGLNTSFRQEYDFDEQRVKEKYLMSYNQHSINWNLKYIAGESYNYYPYLDLRTSHIVQWLEQYSYVALLDFLHLRN